MTRRVRFLWFWAFPAAARLLILAIAAYVLACCAWGLAQALS